MTTGQATATTRPDDRRPRFFRAELRSRRATCRTGEPFAHCLRTSKHFMTNAHRASVDVRHRMRIARYVTARGPVTHLGGRSCVRDEVGRSTLPGRCSDCSFVHPCSPRPRAGLAASCPLRACVNRLLNDESQGLRNMAGPAQEGPRGKNGVAHNQRRAAGRVC